MIDLEKIESRLARELGEDIMKIYKEAISKLSEKEQIIAKEYFKMSDELATTGNIKRLKEN